MSCRAFGRGVEAVALGWLCRWADVGCVSGRFVDTGKNAPAAKFLRDLKCEWTGDGSWRLTRPLIEVSAKARSEEHTSELQSRLHLVCRLLLEKKNQSAKKLK